MTWVQQRLTELHVPLALPNLLWCDNQYAISLASNPVFHARTKHVEIDYQFILEMSFTNTSRF